MEPLVCKLPTLHKRLDQRIEEHLHTDAGIPKNRGVGPIVQIDIHIQSILSNCLSSCYYDRTAFECGVEGISELSKYAYTVHGQFGFRKERAHIDRRFICYVLSQIYKKLQSTYQSVDVDSNE